MDALQFAGRCHVTFSDPQTGWVTGGPAGDRVFKTQDGGITWQNANPDLSLESSILAYEPFYVDGQNILAMSSLGSTVNNLTLHVFGGLPDGWMEIDQATVNLSMIRAKRILLALAVGACALGVSCTSETGILVAASGSSVEEIAFQVAVDRGGDWVLDQAASGERRDVRGRNSGMPPRGPP